MKMSLRNFFPVALVMAFMFMVVCCQQGGAPSYDSRLSRADSLLRCNDPDSALGLLTAIDGAKLSSAGDRAYHALLLTQAQYRCYADITSDSIINVALDYYKGHDGEREKLTRVYIYKGAVMEVLGDAEQAMSLYKQALSVAEPEDQFNLGYANLRIGYIYRDNLVKDSSDIMSLKQALHHFEQVPDSFYMATCLSSIGSSYSAIEKRDSAMAYLECADRLIKLLKLNELEVINLRYLADEKMFSHDLKDIVAAKEIAVKLADKESDERDHLVLIAAYTLAKLNKADSARYYLAQVEKDKLSDGLRVLYYDCFAELARKQGDIGDFVDNYKLADNIADSLVNNETQRQLRDVEAKYDNEALKYEALRYKSNWLLSLMGALLAVSALAIGLLVLSRKAAQRKRLIASSEDTIEQLQSDAARLASQLAENQTMNEELKATIAHQIDTFTQLVEMHYTQFTRFPKKFGELFKKAYSVEQPDVSFWTGIRAYADSTCQGIITQTLASHPSLAETDVNFLGLCCCDLPTTVIMACMGYNDAHSVYNKKRRVAEALGLKGKLDDYIMGFKLGEELEVRS